MKLEHKKEEIVPLKQFVIRVGKYSAFAGILVVFSIGLGMLGYHHFGNLSWLDSFYMSAMILTGMGPVETMTTESAKLFSAFYALYSGIAFLSITAVFFAPIVHRLMHIFQLEPDQKN
ncbi:MAG: hypothetical protein HYZ14_08555 [Bacteroidetes bacterium]|nr:hypothetical protein [Bacteroidota bacterium]